MEYILHARLCLGVRNTAASQPKALPSRSLHSSEERQTRNKEVGGTYRMPGGDSILEKNKNGGQRGLLF